MWKKLGKLKSLLFNLLKVTSVLIIVPPIINYAALKREHTAMSGHGLHYDVFKGQRLFLSCKGDGVPTVLMDSPIGLNSDFWIPLQEKLSKITKVCVYDRAGLGLSERPFESFNSSDIETKKKLNQGKSFTIEKASEDLRRLISSASDQKRPLMFVTTEYGSLLARFYAQIYEDNISHMVLINPLVENLFLVDNGIWKDFWQEALIPKWYSYAIGSAIGLNRFLLIANLIKPQMNLNDLGEEISNRQKYLMCEPNNLFSMVDEFSNLNESLAQMKILWNIKQFPQNISVTILNSKADSVFMLTDKFEDKSFNNDKNKLVQAWQKSIDHLKNSLHPNANKIDTNESLYKQIYKNPDYLSNIIKSLINKWRLANVQHKSA